jgi:hypothetical protein
VVNVDVNPKVFLPVVESRVVDVKNHADVEAVKAKSAEVHVPKMDILLNFLNWLIMLGWNC